MKGFITLLLMLIIITIISWTINLAIIKPILYLLGTMLIGWVIFAIAARIITLFTK